VQNYFDSLHGSILLKPYYRVNRPAESKPGTAYRGFCAAAHAIGNISMMGVKDYFHF
jgi:hypothetical protein